MTESVFTYAAPGLKFGRGASDEIGWDVQQLCRDVPGEAARRVLLVTDPGVAATGHPERIADGMRSRGLEVVVYAEARVEPTDASLEAAVAAARASGPFHAVVAVGGGSSIDTAKAVDLMLTNPGELMDYVNAPVGGGRAPEHPLLPLVAVPTTTGTGAESTTICVLDVLALEVKTGISPRPVAAHPRRRRPRPDDDAARDGDRVGGHGHPLPRARELDGAVVRRLRRQAARAAGALLRRQPHRRHVGREVAVAPRRSVPARGPRRLRRRGARADGPRRHLRRAGLRQRRRPRPARLRLPDRRPGPRLPSRGLPRGRADRPARDGRRDDRARRLRVPPRRRARAPPPCGRAPRRHRRAAPRRAAPA